MKLSLKPEPTESKFKEAVSVFPPLIRLEFLLLTDATDATDENGQYVDEFCPHGNANGRAENEYGRHKNRQ